MGRSGLFSAATALGVCALFGCALILQIDEVSYGAEDSGLPTADATADVDAGCRHDLCEDFEEHPLGASPWTGESVTTGGSLTLDPDASVSPPYSLRASLNSNVGLAEARLAWRVGRAVRGVSCSFWMRVDQAGVNDFEALRVLFEDTPGTGVTDYNVSIHLGPPRVIESSGGLLNAGYPFAAPDTGLWREYKLTVSLSPPSQITLAIGGLQVLKADLSPPSSSSPGMTLWIGAWEDQGGDWTLHFDDVTADLQK
jgi:hypothetical protein